MLRGLHYQLVQPQGKLVRCARGQVFDVAVDVRRGSPTFGQSVCVLLDDVAHHQLWVPPGFAHGFLVLSEVADFCYLCSEYYPPPRVSRGLPGTIQLWGFAGPHWLKTRPFSCLRRIRAIRD